MRACVRAISEEPSWQSRPTQEGSGVEIAPEISQLLSAQSVSDGPPRLGQSARPNDSARALINGWAHAAECVLHGTPSGLDNSVSCHGNAMRLCRTDPGAQLSFESVPDFPPICVMLTNTLVPRRTREQVASRGAQRDSTHRQHTERQHTETAHRDTAQRDSTQRQHRETAHRDSTQNSTRNSTHRAAVEGPGGRACGSSTLLHRNAPAFVRRWQRCAPCTKRTRPSQSPSLRRWRRSPTLSWNLQPTPSTRFADWPPKGGECPAHMHPLFRITPPNVALAQCSPHLLQVWPKSCRIGPRIVPP